MAQQRDCFTFLGMVIRELKENKQKLVATAPKKEIENQAFE
jgi:hypothetical protein